MRTQSTPEEANILLQHELPHIKLDAVGPLKTNWLQLEMDMRKMLTLIKDAHPIHPLEGSCLLSSDPKVILYCLDAILGYHTGRGSSLEW